ncbi:hypothetical protein GCM10027020_11860 [Nocardioides salsibiostraticola]
MSATQWTNDLIREPTGGPVGGWAVGDSLMISVHGPAGSIDLVVPSGATGVDLSREYAEQADLSYRPAIVDRHGHPLATEPLIDAGVTSGSVLVALSPPGGGESGRRTPLSGATDDSGPGRSESGAVGALGFSFGAACAGLAGWYAASQPADGTTVTATLVLLLAGAVLGLLPIGRYAAQRVAVAPVFGAAAAFAVAWDPDPVRLPTTVGIAALAAAVTAAVGRALAPHAEEVLRVWILSGVGLFVVATGAALLDLDPQVVWAVLLLAAMLAARFVPGVAIDVPDQFLLDLERLAVSAWSARDRPRGRRGRIVVPRSAMESVARSGTRLLTASSVAVLVVAAASAPLLLTSATAEFDRVGARCLVGFAGAALLLAARSYRHRAPRGFLRAAGLVCSGALLADLVRDFDASMVTTIGVVGLAVGTTVVLAAVATGRGWRSAWWSRRAEVAEGLTAALALASLVVASGVFRSLIEL